MLNFIDVETTGLNPAEHEVIEVGIVSWDGIEGHQIQCTEFSWPFDPAKADEKALEVNGWGKRDFADQVSIDVGLGLLIDHFEHKDDYFLAWHAHFDTAFLEQSFRRQGMKPPWSHRRVIDIPTLVMGKVGILTRGTSRDMMRGLGLEGDFEGRHTAITDAIANYRVFRRLDLFLTD